MSILGLLILLVVGGAVLAKRGGRRAATPLEIEEALEKADELD